VPAKLVIPLLVRAKENDMDNATPWGKCSNCGAALDPSGMCLDMCFAETVKKHFVPKHNWVYWTWKSAYGYEHGCDCIAMRLDDLTR